MGRARRLPRLLRRPGALSGTPQRRRGVQPHARAREGPPQHDPSKGALPPLGARVALERLSRGGYCGVLSANGMLCWVPQWALQEIRPPSPVGPPPPPPEPEGEGPPPPPGWVPW